MSFRSTGSVALALLLSCSSSGETPSVPPLSAVWNTLFRKAGNSHLRTVRFLDANRGIVAGEATAFFRTDDGGGTWIQQEHLPTTAGGDVAAMDVHPADSLLHAVGRDGAGLGRVWTSPNSVTWNAGASAGSPFTSVDSVGPSDAYYLRQDGTIDHWQGAQSSTLSVGIAGTWNILDFYQTGGPAIVGGSAGIARGTGNPMTFTLQTLPAFSTSTFYDLQYAPASTDIAYACGTGGAVVKTTNASAATPTWTAAAGTIPTSATLRSIMFPNNDLVGWVVGNTGGIWATADGGVNWTSQTSNTIEDLYDIWVMPVGPSQYTCFAVGNYGTVLKMTTNPTTFVMTWANLTDPTPNLRPTLNGVDFIPDGSRGLVVGRHPAGLGVILRTLDGGATWTDVTAGGGPTPPAVPLEFLGVSVPSLGTNYTRAFACGTNGTIWRTMDFTATPIVWEALATGTAATLRAIHFPTTEFFGYCAGDTSLVLRTNNGGDPVPANVVWAAQAIPGPPPGSYYALSSTLAGTNVYASGAGGKVARGIAAGTVWADFSIAGGGAIRALQAFSGPSALELYAGSNTPNAVYYAVDLGGSISAWLPTAGTPPGPANGLTFTGPGTGWGVTGNGPASDPGQIFMTTNGGTLWSASPEHTHWPYNAVWANSAGVGYAVGNFGTIVKTVTGGQ